MYTSVFEGKECGVQKPEMKRHRLVGLQDNERNILDIVKPQIEQNLNDNDIDDDVLNNAGNENNNIISLDQYLRSNKSSVLSNILNELKNSNIDKWNMKTIEDLYPGLLTAGSTLMDETTVKELNIICMELCCITGCNWASSNMVKAEIVNSIVKAFGGDNFVQVERRKKQIFNPESLVTHCVNYIKSNNFPKEHIQIPIASLWQKRNKNRWYSNATIPLNSFVPSNERNQVKTIEFFSYPEYFNKLADTNID